MKKSYRDVKSSDSESSETPFEVFFDGDCPLCRREIEMIRRKDKLGKLILTDIAESDFEPGDRSLDTLMRQIHGRHSDGTYVEGVEVFRQIYQRIGFSGLVKTTRWPLIGYILDFFYKIFAGLRYRHAMHRIGKKKLDCDDSTCVESPIFKHHSTS